MQTRDRSGGASSPARCDRGPGCSVPPEHPAPAVPNLHAAAPCTCGGMVVHHYDPHFSCSRVVGWSRTAYPAVLHRLDFWLCALAHGALVVLLRFDMLRFPDDIVTGGMSGGAVLVPVELAVPLLALAVLVVSLHTCDALHRHEEATKELALVGEEVCVFVLELQAAFGRVDAVLPLRFAAAKYALASVYVFFFVITRGSVPSDGWAEIKAKGLLDEAEAHFMESRYNGDRMAMLHVWAMWAANEAHSVAQVSGSACRDSPTMCSVALSACRAGGLDRMAKALRASQTNARTFAGRIATPAPFHMVQLRETLVLLVLLLWAAVAAPLAVISYYVATGAYVVLLVVLLGLREAAAGLEDPLRSGMFPVSDAVNTTVDVVGQLLVSCSSGSFNPGSAWRELGHALFTQGQVERRTPPSGFPQQGTGPRRWKSRNAPQFGEKPPAPLVDVGCCHLDEKGLAARRGAGPSGRSASHRSTGEQLERLWHSPTKDCDIVSGDTLAIQPASYQRSNLGTPAEGGLRSPRSNDSARISEAVSNESSLVGSVPEAAPFVGAGGVSKKVARKSRRVGDASSSGVALRESTPTGVTSGVCSVSLARTTEPHVLGSRDGPASCWVNPKE